MKFLSDLEYEQRGAGEVIYLIHAGVHSAWFAPLFHEPALDGFRVIRPIRPGYGRSRTPDDHVSLADHARACGRLLRELGVERAHWVGHSSSCCIALQAALDDPTLVASMILFETAKPSGPLRERYAATYVGPAMAAAAGGDVARAFDIFVGGVGGDGYAEALEARLGRDGVAQAVGESAFFFADELPALRDWTFDADTAGAVAVPALVVLGAETRPWFVENSELLAGMLPRAETVTLAGLGHLGPLTHPAELAPVIAEFVRGQDRPPG